MALNVPIHKSILLRVLKDIYSNADIAPYLGFKGGAAAHIFYGLERFSVDKDWAKDNLVPDAIFLLKLMKESE